MGQILILKYQMSCCLRWRFLHASHHHGKFIFGVFHHHLQQDKNLLTAFVILSLRLGKGLL